MHVLFVHAALPGVPFNSSIAALSGWLKREGYTTALLVVRQGVEDEEIQKTLRDSGADVVAFSYMTCCEDWNRDLIALTRRTLPKVRIIAGGAHPTTYPDRTLDTTDVDAICVGEGEEPLRLWLEDPSRHNPGILRKGKQDELERWWVPSPDDLPDWDRGLFGDCTNAGNRYEQAVGVALSRGFCPFTCTFCGVDAYRRINKQPLAGAMRLRSVGHVVAELERARHIVPVDHGFAAWDEILPLRRTWVQEFFQEYKARINLPFTCQLRVEQVTPALVKALADGGCDYVVVGVESGDEAYRKRFLDKKFTNAQAQKAFDLLHEAGIHTFGSFMVGMPFETPAMLAKTVRLAKQLSPGELSWKFYTPERGTRLIELCEKYDLLIDKYIDEPFGGHEPMIKMPNCSSTDVQRATQALEMLREGTKRGTFERWESTEQKVRPVLEYRLG